MRNDDGVEILGLLADGRETPREIAHAQARVDQNAGLRGRQERRVPPAAARQYAKPDDNNSPLLCFSRRTLPGTMANSENDPKTSVRTPFSS